VDAVAHKRLTRTGGDPQTNWSVGIGTGSQIYSVQSDIGELIPPQNHPGAPFIDEVIQTVSVARDSNNRNITRNFPVSYEDSTGTALVDSIACKDSAYYIHQSGVYQKDTVLYDSSYYSPLLAEKEGVASYGTVVWPQIAHVPSRFESQVLMWQNIRDVGNGGIEIISALYNYGDVIPDYHNMPWGGVRESRMPVHAVGNSDGSATIKSAAFGDGEFAVIRRTGGWSLFSSSTEDNAQALAYVFGTDKNLNQPGFEKQWSTSMWRYGSGSSLAKYTGMAPRDYFVGVVVPRVKVHPGDLFFWRWYLVLGERASVMEEAHVLADSVEYGFISPNMDSAQTIDVYFDNREWTLENRGVHAGILYDRPVTGTKPVFLMEDTSGGIFELTTDPAVYNNVAQHTFNTVSRPYLASHNTKALLGFGTDEQISSLKSVTSITSHIRQIKTGAEVKAHRGRLILSGTGDVDEVVISSIAGRVIERRNINQTRSVQLHVKSEGVVIVQLKRAGNILASHRVSITE
jgi:hypothetical protein